FSLCRSPQHGATYSPPSRCSHGCNIAGCRRCCLGIGGNLSMLCSPQPATAFAAPALGAGGEQPGRAGGLRRDVGHLWPFRVSGLSVVPVDHVWTLCCGPSRRLQYNRE
ncbi:unnamed protein product, partial [Polarella glacialis]